MSNNKQEQAIAPVVSFVPTVVPHAMVDDTLLVKLRDRKATTALDATVQETVAEVSEGGLYDPLAGTITGAIVGKKAQKLFQETMLDYSPEQLVQLGMLKPEQMEDFRKYQETAIATRDENRLKKAELRAKMPARVKSAEEQVAADKKREQAKTDRLNAAKQAAIALRAQHAASNGKVSHPEAIAK